MTPEDIKRAAIDDWGDVMGQAIWVWLDRLLAGERIYWARRYGRQLEESTIYDQRAAGRSVVAVAAALRCSRRTVQRAYRRELARRRKVREQSDSVCQKRF